MKTTLVAFLGLSLCAQATTITTPLSVQVHQNDWSAPYRGTVVFDLIWGPSGPSDPTIMTLGAGPGRVSELRAQDLGPGGLMFLAFVTPMNTSVHEWHIRLTYGADRSFSEIYPDYFGAIPTSFPVNANYVGNPYIYQLNAEPLQNEIYGGRFTFTSEPNGASNVPEEASTGLLLFLGLAGLALLRRGNGLS